MAALHLGRLEHNFGRGPSRDYTTDPKSCPIWLGGFRGENFLVIVDGRPTQNDARTAKKEETGFSLIAVHSRKYEISHTIFAGIKT